MTESSAPITFHSLLRPRCCTINVALNRRNSTDCSGDHAVMAKQVRPWLAKPSTSAALRVLQTDRGANQHIPLGTAARPHKSPNVRLQSSLLDRKSVV